MEEKVDKIEKEFRKKFRKLSNDEVQELDAELVEILPDLMEFYGGYHPKGRNAGKKKQRYLDYLYMYYILHPNYEWDERYANQIFVEAVKYANKRC